MITLSNEEIREIWDSISQGKSVTDSMNTIIRILQLGNIIKCSGCDVITPKSLWGPGLITCPECGRHLQKGEGV